METKPRLRSLSQRFVSFQLLRAGAWTASVVLTVRGLTGIAQTALGQAEDVPWGVAAADPFFLLGGLLFAAGALQSGRTTAISSGR